MTKSEGGRPRLSNVVVELSNSISPASQDAPGLDPQTVIQTDLMRKTGEIVINGMNEPNSPAISEDDFSTPDTGTQRQPESCVLLLTHVP